MNDALSLHFLETLTADLRRVQAAKERARRPAPKRLRRITAVLLCVVSMSLVSGV